MSGPDQNMRRAVEHKVTVWLNSAKGNNDFEGTIIEIERFLRQLRAEGALDGDIVQAVRRGDGINPRLTACIPLDRVQPERVE